MMDLMYLRVIQKLFSCYLLLGSDVVEQQALMSIDRNKKEL